MKENIILTKTYDFAVKIVLLSQEIRNEKREFSIADQILRSGTSIGANMEEAMGGQSAKDFFAKLTISYKEARETKYWLRLLKDTNIITLERQKTLYNDIEEILRIIGSIQKTHRQNNPN
ncbi:MAG: four helix bundle protein [Crocinitomicaceae bacterium]